MWPSRVLPSGRSLGLLPFKDDPKDPPDPPMSGYEKDLDHFNGGPASSRRERVIWIHLHKFGGTLMCKFAMVNQGERVSRKNCCWPGDEVMGRGWGLPYAHLAKCRERSQQKDITFSMVERGLTEGDLGCEGVITGTMLRDPLRGMLSSIAYHGLDKDNVLPRVIKAIESKSDADIRTDFTGLAGRHIPQLFDNYVVRTLSGRFDVLPGCVTRAHLEEARQVLIRIDVVMVLEDLSDGMLQASRLFKWEVSASELPVENPTSRIIGSLGDEVERFLKERNALDYELFEFGRALARNRTRLLLGAAP